MVATAQIRDELQMGLQHYGVEELNATVILKESLKY